MRAELALQPDASVSSFLGQCPFGLITFGQAPPLGGSPGSSTGFPAREPVGRTVKPYPNHSSQQSLTACS